ncbi:TonB family protein [Luteolibacter algae]|uniref:TonB family protein n=1 Tax=Luteolibacter algae TaxID=454151 RepID=A0ABW5D519_9BACT
MNYRAVITGIAASALLLAVLGFARLFTVTPDTPELLVREIETATVESPPPPPPMESPPPDAPPPPPALTQVSTLPDPSRVPIPQAQVPMDISAPVENFFTDLAPAPLPVAPAPAPVRRVAAPSKPSPATRPAPPRRTPAPPVAKSHYSTSELDGTPRLLRHGSASFPSSLSRKGVTRGTVVLEVELSTSGSVSIRRVVSSSYPELVSPARRVASGARFTPPKKNGQAVKAIMRWPIVIEK